MNLETAKQTLRESFLSLNQDLLKKLDKYQKTRSFSGTLGSHHFDFKDFFETMQEGFTSPLLHELFELMMLMYFFRGCCEMSFDIEDYIKRYEFNEAKFLKEGRGTAEVLIAVRIAHRRVAKILRTLGVTDHSFLTNERNNYEALRNVLKIIHHAKGFDLHHRGDKAFVVSRIRKTGKPYVFDPTVTLVDSVMYVDKPEQIVAMAYAAKPGIYMIANVPYGQKAESAFYLLFVTAEDAYLVDNNKHSYRDQIYRGKTDGTSGEDAWMWKRYEYVYFPIEEILEFFETRSERKDVVVKEEGFSFIKLKKISECATETIIFSQAFVDNCVTKFRKTDILEGISPAVAFQFMQKQLAGSSENLPALYQSEVPSLDSIDPTWSSEYVEVDGPINALSIVEEAPNLSIEKLDTKKMPIGLTSLEQMKGHIVFTKRKQEAKMLADKLDRDFRKNYRSVMKELQDFVRGFGPFVIERAMADEAYPVREFSQFCSPKKGGSEVEKQKILFSLDETENRVLRNSGGRAHFHYSMWGGNSVYLMDGKPVYRGHGLCDYCHKYSGKGRYVIQFMDVAQFEAFFKIDETVKLPRQFRKYLNQNPSRYYGNSILDDIDPMCLIHNPWWIDYFSRNRDGEVIRSNRDNPTFFVRFDICGFCRRKLTKTH